MQDKAYLPRRLMPLLLSLPATIVAVIIFAVGYDGNDKYGDVGVLKHESRHVICLKQFCFIIVGFSLDD